MTKFNLTLATALFFGLMLSVGGAMAGDGKSCGDKKKDDGTAVIVAPTQPLA